jgi:hypothetical protein
MSPGYEPAGRMCGSRLMLHISGAAGTAIGRTQGADAGSASAPREPVSGG